MDRIRIRRITATTAAGAGKALGAGGGATAIRLFPRWGLALRVPVFIFTLRARREKRRISLLRRSVPLHRFGQNTLRTNAQLLLPQAFFAGGICFLPVIRAKTVRRAAEILTNL
jgi:hypothetical protein